MSTDKRVAERMRAELIRQRDLELAGLGAVEGMGMELSELRDAYLADLVTRVGDSQFRNVRLRLDHTLAALSAKRVRDLRVVDVLRFRAERVKAGAAARTANCDVSALKAMLKWAVESQLIAESPLRGIRRLPDGEAHQRCRRRAMTEKEVAAFLAAAAEDDLACAPVRRGRGALGPGLRVIARIPQAPLWTFLTRCGARYGEARTLAWADVDLEARTVTLRAELTKSHRARCVPISLEFAAELADLRRLQERALRRAVKPGERVFLSPNARALRTDTVNAMRVFDRLLERAGIARVDELGRKLDIHALRGTCASNLARRGVGIAIAQRLLGHSSPTLTARHYVHLGVEDLRVAVEDAGGAARERGVVV